MSEYILGRRIKIPSRFTIINLSVFLLVLLIVICSLALEKTGWVHEHLDMFWWKYFLIGTIAGCVSGIIGMAYGIIVVTSLLSLGLTTVAASLIVHICEIFGSGINGISHYRYKNVNKKTFKKLLIPGILGAMIGSSLLYKLLKYQNIVKPVIAFYILIIGGYIIYKASHKPKPGKKIKQIQAVSFLSAVIDAIGGGWQILVSTTIIAGGRNALYTIGAVSGAKFFVALTASLTLFAWGGNINWQAVFWITLGNLWIGPAGPYIAKKLPRNILMMSIGIIVICISIYQLVLYLVK